MTHWLRGFGPSMPRPIKMEALRVSLGAGLGLGLTGFVLWLLTPVDAGLWLGHPVLIAPLGASAVLIFAVPTSPLAQPWPVVIGNSVSALVAFAVLLVLPPALPAAALAVALAMGAMVGLRALHPPGGAVALFVVMAASPDHLPGLHFLLVPVLSGSTALVLCGLVWNRLIDRPYPSLPPSR